MNKTELVSSVMEKSGLTRKQAEAALAAYVASVKEALKAGEKVTLVGFGTFSVKKRAARKGRNPATGRSIKIKASKTPAFKAGTAFKDAIK